MFYTTTPERIIAYTFTVLTFDIPTLAMLLAIFITLSHLVRARKLTEQTGGKLRWQGIATVGGLAVLRDG